MTPSREPPRGDVEAAPRVAQRRGAFQGRPSTPGLADEFLGSVRRSQFGSAIEAAVATARRNPITAMLLAAGAGWLIYRMSH